MHTVAELSQTEPPQEPLYLSAPHGCQPRHRPAGDPASCSRASLCSHKHAGRRARRHTWRGRAARLPHLLFCLRKRVSFPRHLLVAQRLFLMSDMSSGRGIQAPGTFTLWLPDIPQGPRVQYSFLAPQPLAGSWGGVPWVDRPCLQPSTSPHPLPQAALQTRESEGASTLLF